MSEPKIGYTCVRDGIEYGIYKFPKAHEMHVVPMDELDNHNFTTECRCNPTSTVMSEVAVCTGGPAYTLVEHKHD